MSGRGEDAAPLARRCGAAARCRRGEGRRQGCGRQPRFAISPSQPPPPPAPSLRWGWHRHAPSRQEPSQAPGLRCPLLARKGFSCLALPPSLDISFCVCAFGVDAALWGGCSPPAAAVWPWRRQSLVDRS